MEQFQICNLIMYSKIKKNFLKQFKYYINEIFQKFLKFLEFQIFLNLISWPILLHWGLPLSILSPIGNIIFAPMFLVFILVSGLIFFSEILNIPNSVLVYVLNKTTEIWAYFLSFGSDKFLWGSVKPPIIFSIIIIVSTFFVLKNKKIFTTNLRKITGFIAIFILGFLFLYFYKPGKLIKNINCGSKQVQVIYYKNKTSLIFNEPVISRLSYSSWVSFKLIPELIKNTGDFRVDNLIIFNPTILTLNIAKFIALNFRLKNLYLPNLKEDQILSQFFSENIFKSLNIITIDSNCDYLDLGEFKLNLVKLGTGSKRSLSLNSITSEPINL